MRKNMKKLFKVSSEFYIAIVVCMLVLSSCSYEPKPFDYGKDVCEHCKMTIIDPKWGAQIITNTGKIYRFDVIECLILYKNQNQEFNSKIKSIWTINYLKPGTFIKAEDAFFIKSPDFNSPMGLNAVTIKNEEDAKKIKLTHNPEILKWEDLQRLVKEEFSVTNQ